MGLGIGLAFNTPANGFLFASKGIAGLFRICEIYSDVCWAVLHWRAIFTRFLEFVVVLVLYCSFKLLFCNKKINIQKC